MLVILEKLTHDLAVLKPFTPPEMELASNYPHDCTDNSLPKSKLVLNPIAKFSVGSPSLP
jgi:hypothetical protein